MRFDTTKTLSEPMSAHRRATHQTPYAWARASSQGQNFIPIVGAFTRAYDVRAKELVVVFNEKNVVVRHAMTDNTRVVKTGLGNSGSEPPAPVQPKPPS